MSWNGALEGANPCSFKGLPPDLLSPAVRAATIQRDASTSDAVAWGILLPAERVDTPLRGRVLDWFSANLL
jgi:hypothetical protein